MNNLSCHECGLGVMRCECATKPLGVPPDTLGEYLDGLSPITGWLVEEDGPHWIALTDEPKNFTYADRFGSQIKRVKDSSDALRFSRRRDAEAFIAHFVKFLINPVATEHVWG